MELSYRLWDVPAECMATQRGFSLPDLGGGDVTWQMPYGEKPAVACWMNMHVMNSM